MKTKTILLLTALLPLAACANMDETMNKGYRATADGLHSMTDTVNGWFDTSAGSYGHRRKPALKPIARQDQALGPFQPSSPPALVLVPAPGDASNPCPPVSVDEGLRDTAQYSNQLHRDPAHLISSAHIESVNGACTFADDSVSVAVTIDIKGTIGPKGRRRPGDKPSFSYPYIVGVTDQAGEVVAEQVFGTTLAYDSKDSVSARTEHIRQIIPLTDHKAGEYKLAIGFQIPAPRDPIMLPATTVSVDDGPQVAASAVAPVDAAPVKADTGAVKARAAKHRQSPMDLTEPVE